MCECEWFCLWVCSHTYLSRCICVTLPSRCVRPQCPAVTHALSAVEVTQGSRCLQRRPSPTARHKPGAVRPVPHICNRSCWHIKIAASGFCPVNPGAGGASPALFSICRANSAVWIPPVCTWGPSGPHHRRWGHPD